MKKSYLMFLSIFLLSSIGINAQEAQWAQKIAGTDSDGLNSIAVDGSDNVYVAGYFYSNTLTLNNGITLSNSGALDGYIAKYDSSGLCQWAQKIAGTDMDEAYSIAVDGSGNVYVAGYFSYATLNLNNGITLSNSGFSDAYIAKYNSSGLCQWAQKIAGTDMDEAYSIAVDGSGNVYVAGYFSSYTLTLNNGITLSSSGGYDAFIAKYNSSGLCQWAQKIAGTSSDYGNSIAVDGSGNVYVAGNFYSTTLTLNNGITLSNSDINSYDAYIAKYNSSGLCQWAENIAGTDYDYGNSIAVDGSGNVYVAGYFYSTTLTLNNGITLSSSGGYDAYIAKYNSSGLCQWAENIAGAGYDYSRSIAVDGSGNVYVAGYFTSPILTLNNGITLSNSGSTDGYIAQYNSSGLCQWAQKIAGISDDASSSIVEDGSGNVYVAGNFYSTTLTLNNRITLSNSGDYDGYIAKYVTSYPISDEQNIYLSNGWNLISSYVQPQSPDAMNNVMSEIENNLLIAKNNRGQVFIPSYNINTIGKWDVTQGYLCYMSAPDTLKISGNEVVPSQTPIQLSAGWNTIAYLRNSEMNAADAFVSITDNNNLLIAKTLDGKVYIPSYGINTIGNLKPGVGYRVYVTTSDELIYPGN